MHRIITIHSVVDLITNSSSEIFTRAKTNSPEIINSFVNEILRLAGSDKTATDLFRVELVYPVRAKWDVDSPEDYRGGPLSEKELAEHPTLEKDSCGEYDGDGFCQTKIRITAIDPANKDAVEALLKLDNLQLYETCEVMC